MNNDSQLDALLKQTAEDHRSQLPSPGLIWWRAQILRKQQEQARIERPMRIMRMAATVVCLAVLAALVTTNREPLQTLWAGQTWILLPLGLALLTASLLAAFLLRWSTHRR